MGINLIEENGPLTGRHHIQAYLDQGEGRKIEFKQRLARPDKIAKTICALANTDGGTLLIGIKDNKTIVDADAGQEKHILNEALSFHCGPRIYIELTEVFVEEGHCPHEKSILMINIPESREKPHSAKNDKGEWKVYIRHNDKTMAAGTKTEKALQTRQPFEQKKKPKLDKNQQRLLAYLKRHERITLKQYAALVNISERRSRRELTEALQTGLVRVLELEKEDYYIL